MYVQVVTYGLGGAGESEYLDVANAVAPRFSFMPGLQAKLWLEDPDQGRYGAVYFWDDRESMERFLRSDLFEATNPDFVDVASEGFGVLENLTAQTQPVLQLVEGRRQPAPARRPPTAPATKAPARATAGAGGGARPIPVKSGTASATKATAKKTSAKKAPAAKKVTAATKAPAAKKATAKKTTG